MEITQERIVAILKDEPQFKREYHGSLFDRGAADSYYGRSPKPHWMHQGERITNLTVQEINEYMLGYDENEKFGDRKDWG